MVQLILLIVVSALAWRGASFISYSLMQPMGALNVPLAFAQPPLKSAVMLYALAALPLAFLNGYLLEFSWIHALIAAGGTWAGMLVANMLFRFNAAIQFMLFGTVTVVWLFVNCIRAFS